MGTKEKKKRGTPSGGKTGGEPQRKPAATAVAQPKEPASAATAVAQSKEPASVANTTRRVLVKPVALQQQLQAVLGELNDARLKYRDTTANFGKLKLAVQELEAEKSTLLEYNEALQRQVGQLEEQAKGEQDRMTQLRSEMETLGAIERSRLRDFERVKLEAFRNKAALAQANAQVEQLRHKVLQANQQVLKTRETLSFQLGYALIFGFKSFAGFRALPGRLLALLALSKKRLVEKQACEGLISQLETAAPGREPFQRCEPGQLLSDVVRERLRGLHDCAGERLLHQLKSLKVATVMDEFTYNSYSPECTLLQLSPTLWEQELEKFQPELLFIESAWRGKDSSWTNMIGHRCPEIVKVVEWCKSRKIPTVFWNKEDPVHYITFLNTAKMFDYVFTTDIDCIHRYKGSLGHDRVYLLPFACQPRMQNPVEKYERKDAFVFAGAYYLRYPDRIRDLVDFVANLPGFKPLEIYDRNFGKDDPNYRFPEEYQPFIVGTLPHEQIDKAYKGYRFAINMNSIKQSQSMFARRIYELLASNTLTVSNFSRGLRLMFGDLVITSDCGKEILRRLQAITAEQSTARKFRLMGLRKVFAEHTYADRIAHVVSKVHGKTLPPLLQPVLVTAYVNAQDKFEAILTHYARQTYPHKSLLFVLAGGFTPLALPEDKTITVLSAAGIQDSRLGEFVDLQYSLIAGMVAEDYYGPHYLTDLALATRYWEGPAIGKDSHYAHGKRGVILVGDGAQYRPAKKLAARSALVRRDALEDVPLRAWVTRLYTHTLELPGMLAVDEFNYCRNGAQAPDVPTQVDDALEISTGNPLAELYEKAENISASADLDDFVEERKSWKGDALFAALNSPPLAISFVVNGTTLQVESTLPEGQHQYIYSRANFSPRDLGFTDKVKFYLDASPGLNLQFLLLFIGDDGQRVGHVIRPANWNQEADIPEGTVSIRFGLRIYSSGSCDVNALYWDHVPSSAELVLGQAEHLLVTNTYPSYDRLYRHAFVHSRIAAYRALGVRVDVFCLQPSQGLSAYEFENIDILQGDARTLNLLMENGNYRSVLVHFMDDAIWEVLRHVIDQTRVIVWLHGAEIQPCHRRACAFTTEDALAKAMKVSEKRMAFWRGLLSPAHPNLKLIFVSEQFAHEAIGDLGITLDPSQYCVIHNPINTQFFSYQEKPASQRGRILSIRPFASALYANDLSVKAIQLLADKPYFNELWFHLIGDGKLFEETVAPLRDYSNVLIEQRFLRQNEIAALHKEYGVFLCPSRMDTQGVSRDEAMSSGLVPVTTRVAAIPEFVDEDCGMLAEPEDAEGLAAVIARLYEEPELFQRLSRGAAQRVRAQRDAPKIIETEIDIFA